MRLLHDDQLGAIDALRDAVARGHRRIVVQAPTGWGKTVASAQLVANARNKDKKVLFTVPAKNLVDQTIERFAEHGIYDVGAIQADHHMTDWSQPVQVATVQSLQRRRLPQADVVLIDECHKWFRFYEKLLCDPGWKDVPIIGLSATPWTKGLGAYFKELIVVATTQELIDAGRLSPFKVFAPSHPDLTGVRTVAGDYHEGDLSERMSEKFLVADIVQTWLDKAERRPTLCFAVDRDHAKSLQEQFAAAGVKVAYQDAFTSNEERQAIKRGFHDGSIEVVCSVGTLIVGVDWDVRCIIFARPTKSEMLFTQAIGRGLRIAEGKDYLLILDHSDNHLRLGFVTEIDASHTELDDGRPIADKNPGGEDKVRLPKECPSCSFLKPPHMAKCPNCGFIAERVERPDGIEVRDGELKELKKPQVTMEDKALFLAELKHYALKSGYKEGWASNKYREKFGVWPDHSIVDIPLSSGIRGETASWIKSRQIAWARSKRRFTTAAVAPQMSYG